MFVILFVFVCAYHTFRVVCLSVCPFVCLFVCLFVYIFVFTRIYMFSYLSSCMLCKVCIQARVM